MPIAYRSNTVLEQSFIHLTRIGEPTEWRLWRAGLCHWQDVLSGPSDPAGIGPRRWDLLYRETAESADRLCRQDIAWFAQRLRSGQAWRLFGDLHEHACYLDIETTGGADVTAVVIHLRGQTLFFVRDENLHELPMHLAGVRLLVTYNGRCFDWPVLRQTFSSLPEPAAHLDLRYPFARLKFRGGLKGIEPAIGLSRPAELAGVDGLAAVWLWHRHRRGDRRALPALLRYCAEDVLNLKHLAEWAYNRLAGGFPVNARLFDNPGPAHCRELPVADAQLMDQCRHELTCLRAW